LLWRSKSLKALLDVTIATLASSLEIPDMVFDTVLTIWF
jgi:hypothetical protein